MRGQQSVTARASGTCPYGRAVVRHAACDQYLPLCCAEPRGYRGDSGLEFSDEGFEACAGIVDLRHIEFIQGTVVG